MLPKDNQNSFQTANDCGRQEDLVTYLYDEADAAGRASFERHLDECAACRGELAALSRVRDELSTWQVGFAPRTEIVLPRSRFAVWRELIGLFPIWVRGAALAGAAAALLLVALSIAGASLSLKDGDFALQFGGKSGAATGAASISSQELEQLVQQAVASERARVERDYQAQLAGFKAQLEEQHRAQLAAVGAEQRAQMQALKASLKRELQRANRQNSSIRSFFAMDEEQDAWRDVR